MTTLREYLCNACEEIDAAIFSGDVLYSDSEREELNTYIQRWERAILQHDAIAAIELPEAEKAAQ